ncbi:MAG: hypothetical protein D4R73_11110 [Deltaproteobacteria bacterium]|nr:MAG: hypothetical protein D4R73_11110 [Deltaproteobacteria bacterium]
MSGAQKRLAKLEARNTPGFSLEAAVIDRRPGESREQAAQRYYTEYPERRGSNAPRIYLCLMRGQEVAFSKAICAEEKCEAN